MPFSLPALTRRRFLSGTAAAGLGLLLARRAGAAGEVDPHRFFLLSDPHIAADATTVKLTMNMHDNLKTVCGQLLEADSKAASVLLNGDCAFSSGEVADYATFTELLKPLREAGMPVHLTLGNHDKRDRFWDAVKADKDASAEPGKVVEDKYVTVVEAQRANWYILDSLGESVSAPGLIGAKQIDWLAGELDKRKDKPALVMVHHNPAFRNPNAAPGAPKAGGISDTDELWAALAPREHVKALFFGHTHNWSATKRENIHLINLPAVGYPFAKGKAIGWVDCKLNEKGMELTLRTIDPAHAQSNEKQTLEWR